MPQKWLSKFMDAPIVIKFTIIYICSFVLLILTTLLTSNSYKNDKMETTLNTVVQLHGQTMSGIDNILQNLITISKAPLVSGNDNNNVLLDKWYLYNHGENTLDFQSEIKFLYSQILTYNPDIHSVYFYNTEGDYELKSRYEYQSVPDPGSTSGSEFLQKAIEYGGAPLILGNHPLPDATDSSGEPIQVFSVSRAMRNIYKNEIVGVFTVNISTSILNDLFCQTSATESQTSLLLDENNQVLLSRNYTDFLAGNLDLITEALHLGSSTQRIKIDGVPYIICSYGSSVTPWKMVSILSEDDLFSDIQRTQNHLLVLNLFIMLLVLAILISLSKEIVMPLQDLIALTKEVELGNFSAQIAVRNNDEVGQLSHSFNKMILRTDKLISEKYTNQIKQKELELQMLQNQINPHFLYNTLETIHMMAEINDDTETSEMVQALGNLMRYSISRNISTVCVAEEVQILQDYISLQKVRFEDQFHIHLNIAPETNSILIIKLLLQPLVENSIYHGFSNTEQSGIITISSFLEDHCLIFEVTDNGTGIKPEDLQVLNDYIQGKNNALNSIALRNVYRRVQLHYGPEATILISSTYGQGTTSQIRIPLSDETPGTDADF